MSLPSRAGAVREEAWALQVSGQSRAGRHAERKGGCEETGAMPENCDNHRRSCLCGMETPHR